MIGDVKVERSVPVQGRVDLVELANVAAFAKENDMHIATLSGLIGLAVDIAGLAVERKMGKKTFDRMDDAYAFMEAHRYMGSKVARRGVKKILSAMRFEALRNEGDEPSLHVPTQYNMLHNRNSVKASGLGEEVGSRYEKLDKDEQFQEHLRRYQELKEKDARERAERDLQRSREALARQKAMVDENGIVQVPQHSKENNTCTIIEEPKKEKVKKVKKESDVKRPDTPEELAAKERKIEEEDRRLAGDWPVPNPPVKDNEFVK